MINVEIKKTPTETGMSAIRRFSRKVQEANLIRHVRSLRYFKPTVGETIRKRQTLKMLDRKTEYERLAKLGKKPVKRGRGRR